jgi:hypothetical protein
MKMRATKRAKRSSSGRQAAFGRVAIGRLATISLIVEVPFLALFLLAVITRRG